MKTVIKFLKSLVGNKKCDHKYVTIIFPSMFGISKSTECQKCGHRIEGSEKWKNEVEK